MAVNYRASLKTTRMTAARDDIDSGTGAGTFGTDIIISPSTSITSGQTVEWTAGSITHSA